MSPTILLFDMDGVLLTPGGYHRALMATVARLAAALGFPDAALTQDDVHAFEACGITNEWDSAAICLAALALRAREHSPGLDISPDLLAAPLPAAGGSAPNFRALIERLSDPSLADLPAIPRARAILPPAVHPILDAAHRATGLSHQVQQEHVLGSAQFNRVYGLPGKFGVPSYLETFDRSNLSPADRDRLLGWSRLPGNGLAIFTNRPSMPPDGLFGTPEAELGARVVGLEGVPLAGTGGVVWLEARRGAAPGTFNKPHPLHALAALRMAAFGELVADAFAAAGATMDGVGEASGWEQLDGSEIWLFEDATSGIDSLRIAKELLAANGVAMRIRLVGVTASPVKRAALERAGAVVFPDLATGLESFFD